MKINHNYELKVERSYLMINGTLVAEKMTELGERNVNDFAKDGILIKPFRQNLADHFTETFFVRLQCQAYKLGIIDNLSQDYDVETIDYLVSEIHSKSKFALDFVVQELRETFAAAAILCDEELQNNFSTVLDCPINLIKVHMDGILINLPKNEERLYKFHSESHYYPFRKNFVNFWMPLIRDKTVNNGVMLLKQGGHHKSYSFNEYSGFSKIENYSFSEEQVLHQLEIPDTEITDFQTVCADLPKNQSLFFHQNMPHTSTVNLSDTPSYALILRGFDYRKDITLSDRTGVKPYSGDASKGGFPGLRPLPV